MTSDEIRELYLSFFEGHGHTRLPSASLVPATFDASVMLTTAGMHPLKPYFLGMEKPPAQRLASCQKCFRTPDIENVGLTTRHLTFFEMLGNFSIGDYFKPEAIEMAFKLSTEGFEFDADKTWVTVHEGDEKLGLGPDEEAIKLWEAIGIPRERIVLCPSSENFWQAGPNGPCGPCSELYFDRGVEWGKDDDLPGGENERFLEYWNLVFMQFNQDPPGTLEPLPANNIDTGLGLNRMALIQQGVDSVFDTDQFVPLMELGRSLAKGDTADERPLRILADHARGMTFLIADGVVPSNEDRGYVLRRLMRRAITQGHRLEFKQGFLPDYVDVVTETMGGAYEQLHTERDTILKWVKAEEEGFGKTLESGLQMLDEIIDRGEITGEEAFKLHDTHGFPIDLTAEIAHEREVPVDMAGFEELMGEQRTRSQGSGGSSKVGAVDEVVKSISATQTDFTGYDHLEEEAIVAGVTQEDGRTLVKLDRSPFYAQGGGQVADSGTIECASGDCSATVSGVLRAGDDQAIVIEPGKGTLKKGEKVHAVVDRSARRATEANHTATHLLHAALREVLGTHVRQAGSYVGPDKLRFDFTHGQRLSPEELSKVEDRVNEWIARNDDVSPQTTSLDEAKAAGAMALFGEKYGDIVRMVEIPGKASLSGTGGDGSYSKELCGGTHVRSTGEIGVFKVTSEGSSASNVRRIEALTGPEGVALLRRNDALLNEIATTAKAPIDQLQARVADLQSKAKAAKKQTAVTLDSDVEATESVNGEEIRTIRADELDSKALSAYLAQVYDRFGGTVIGASGADGRALIAVRSSGMPSAKDLIDVMAPVVGGGGGGRDNMAQAGGKNPEKLDDALRDGLQAWRDALAK